MKTPSREEAERLLHEAEKLNSGLWAAHSRTAAVCAEVIARACGLNPDTAYVLGLLHDIGRRYGVTDLRHVIDGYRFMYVNGYDYCSRICLTHSFPDKNILSYNGTNDCSEDETSFIKTYIESTQYDDYDRLIQLCDALSSPDGAVYIEKRLVDVALRRGINDYTLQKWRAFLDLKTYFDEKAGADIYKLLIYVEEK